MPVTVNLRHLEKGNVTLEGELPVEELDIDSRDELIRAARPLEYNVEVQQLEQALLVRGRLRLVLDCDCARCLKHFPFAVELDPYTLHVPLEGEEKAVVTNDCVDLTPFFREDILLEFPRHPLCEPECGGVKRAVRGKSPSTGAPQVEKNPALWAELNKLKF